MSYLEDFDREVIKNRRFPPGYEPSWQEEAELQRTLREIDGRAGIERRLEELSKAGKKLREMGK